MKKFTAWKKNSKKYVEILIKFVATKSSLFSKNRKLPSLVDSIPYILCIKWKIWLSNFFPLLKRTKKCLLVLTYTIAVFSAFFCFFSFRNNNCSEFKIQFNYLTWIVSKVLSVLLQLLNLLCIYWNMRVVCVFVSMVILKQDNCMKKLMFVTADWERFLFFCSACYCVKFFSPFFILNVSKVFLELSLIY